MQHVSVWQSSCHRIFVIIFLRRFSGLDVQPKGRGGPGECFQLSCIGCLGGQVRGSFLFPSTPTWVKSWWLAFTLGVQTHSRSSGSSDGAPGQPCGTNWRLSLGEGERGVDPGPVFKKVMQTLTKVTQLAVSLEQIFFFFKTPVIFI